MYAVPVWKKELPILTPRQQVKLKMSFIFVLQIKIVNIVVSRCVNVAGMKLINEVYFYLSSDVLIFIHCVTGRRDVGRLAVSMPTGMESTA